MFNVKKKAPGGTGMDITCPVLNRLAIGDKECRLHTWSPKPMVPKNVAEILQNHVLLEVEGIDRLYLNGYVSLVQTEGGAATFIRRQLGKPFASTAAVATMSSQFVKDIEAFARTHSIDIITFAKKQRKDDVMQDYLGKFSLAEGVLFIGKAQEKASLFRTVRRKNPLTGQYYPWLTRGTAMPNHFYFYIVDEDFGPLFIKFCSYFPYAVKVCLNGHEWVKRQLAKEGIAYVPLDNGILSCERPERLQELCNLLNAEKIEAVFRKWLARLPIPSSRNIGPLVTATPSPSFRLNSRLPRFSINPGPDGSSSRRSSGKTSTLGGLKWCSSFLIGGSPAVPLQHSARGY
jgi:hypothetical protein